MDKPLHTVDDFVPGPELDASGEGWRFVHYDREVGTAIMQVVASHRETLAHYPQDDECVALIIDAVSGRIVGVRIENYDPKALR